VEQRRNEGRGEQERYLLAGVADSFARGHYRVGLRRYFMLVAREFDAPAELQSEIERAAVRCTPTEIQKMVDSASAWAAMVSRRGAW
jgi:hypothetical protein